MANADFFDDERRDARPGVSAARLLTWLAPIIALAVLLAVYVVVKQQPRGPRPAGGIGESPPLPPPDDDPVFQAVEDREQIRFDELAAYAELLDRVRETPPEELRERARRDVYFADLLRDPERYRGLPIRVQGTARRILPLDDLPEKLAPEGRLYEAWTFTSDSVIGGKAYPYVLVFEEPPEGLPGGFDVHAFVIFHGYFFKLLAYQAGDVLRAAPMLIGRVQFVPEASGRGPIAPGGSAATWLLVPILALVLFLFVRSVTTLRSSLAGPRRRIGAPPRDEISPDELDAFLRSGPPDEDDETTEKERGDFSS